LHNHVTKPNISLEIVLLERGCQFALISAASAAAAADALPHSIATQLLHTLASLKMQTLPLFFTAFN
jgi:hypothetical protein